MANSGIEAGVGGEAFSVTSREAPCMDMWRTLAAHPWCQRDSNKLQQALMADGSEGEKKSLKFGCGIDVWDMLPLVILKNCFLVCLQRVIFLVPL
ncbi:hypothetical protein CK203_053168 [Vitis vinifera]|uniref:Uncharacterized protein n=1 Tax=Vitis vinifera TaxID=29760 RepID=A0A438GP57_VITVI|nr:hypothetical protein CK203_053168 [Vitis vinifera]